jgi:hypothetical protein
MLDSVVKTITIRRVTLIRLVAEEDVNRIKDGFLSGFNNPGGSGANSIADENDGVPRVSCALDACCRFLSTRIRAICQSSEFHPGVADQP